MATGLLLNRFLWTPSLLAVHQLDINFRIADGSLVACPNRGISMLNLGDSFQRSQNSTDSSRVSSTEASGAVVKLTSNSPWSYPGKNSLWRKNLKDHQSAYKREDCDQEDCLAVFQSPGDDGAVLICGSIKPVVESVKNPGDQVSLSLPLDIRVVPPEESIGSRVNETNKETRTAKVTVIPNWKKNRPMIPS